MKRRDVLRAAGTVGAIGAAGCFGDKGDKSIHETLQESKGDLVDEAYVTLSRTDNYTPERPRYLVTAGWDILDSYICEDGESVDKNGIVQEIKDTSFFDKNKLFEITGETYDDFSSYNSVRQDVHEPQVETYRFNLHGTNGHVRYERDAETMHSLEEEDNTRLDYERVWEDFLENGFELRCE